MATELSNLDVEVRRGLADVVAAKTTISRIDGQIGELRYRGYAIADLARNATYEETVYLLLHRELPSKSQLSSLFEELVRYRRMNPALLRMLRSLPGAPTPIRALRTIVSAMSAVDPRPLDKSRDGNRRRAKRLIAQLPTLLAAHCRLRQGEEPIEPSADLGHAANFFYMLHGEAPSALEARVLDIMLILMAEHGLNASTFAVRVVASTLSDIQSAFTAGLGALDGPLHGAANSEAMKMLLEVDSEDNVEGYVKGALAAKRKIMGFGHRVYKTGDPRAVFLRELLSSVGGRMPNAYWCKLADKVQIEVLKTKALHPNVDFYGGPALYGLGFPIEAFTGFFACARSAGWSAHALEQYKDNRLIRPSSAYVGAEDRVYVPLDQR